MNERTNPGPTIFAVALALAVLFGCAVPFGQQTGTVVVPPEIGPADNQVVPEKVITYVGGPRVPHPTHADLDFACTDCHEIDEETGKMGYPEFGTCWDCHEDMEEDLEPEQRIQGRFFDEEGNRLWKKAIGEYDADVIFSHAAHESLEDCTICHGDMAHEDRGRVAGPLYTMAQCMECHQEKQAPNDCETCHKELRTTTPPPSHESGWRGAHGDVSRRLRLTATQHDCSMCHSEPDYCVSCHQVTPPASHAGGNWQQVHGRFAQGFDEVMPQDCALCHMDPDYCSDCHQVTPPRSHKHLWKQRHGQFVRAEGGDFPASCSLCHTSRSFCESCHLDEKPRNHTALWRTRTHGVMAAMDRDSCTTCHHVDFCQRCHEDTAPRTHRGLWSRQRNTHCVQCHFPITSEPNCRVCHQSNPTHSTAPPQPANHIPGRNCRNCHNSVGGGGAMPLRHLDNGQNCEFCHQ